MTEHPARLGFSAAHSDDAVIDPWKGWYTR